MDQIQEEEPQFSSGHHSGLHWTSPGPGPGPEVSLDLGLEARGASVVVAPTTALKHQKILHSFIHS